MAQYDLTPARNLVAKQYYEAGNGLHFVARSSGFFNVEYRQYQANMPIHWCASGVVRSRRYEGKPSEPRQGRVYNPPISVVQSATTASVAAAGGMLSPILDPLFLTSNISIWLDEGEHCWVSDGHESAAWPPRVSYEGDTQVRVQHWLLDA